MQRINDDIVTHTSDKINVDKKPKDKKKLGAGRRWRERGG